MKFNWGTGIALVYGAFVVVFVFLLFKSMTFDNSLVSDHYYADDLNYQQHYDKLANAEQLSEKLVIQNNAPGKQIQLQFPTNLGEVSGDIHLFSPSNSHLDRVIPVKTDSNFLQVIPTAELKPGFWKVKVDWNASGKAYYLEQGMTI